MSIQFITRGIVSAKGAFFVHCFLLHNSNNFFILLNIPPDFFGGICFNAHSNCNDSILVGKPLIIHMCFHPEPLLVVYFAPPLIAPLCALNLFSALLETPTYVQFLFWFFDRKLNEKNLEIFHFYQLHMRLKK